MKKILTISEPNCGGKPMGYAVEIPNDNRDTLSAEIRKGLEKAWYFNECMAKSAFIDEDLDALKEQGYTYIPGDGVDPNLCGAAQGRFLVEVTILDEVEVDKPKRSTKVPVFPFKNFKVEADVDWDCDEGVTPPDRKFEVVFTPDELTPWGVLDKGGIEDVNTWFIDEVKLNEVLSDYLTDFTDFCHKGFTFTWDYER